MSAIGLAGLLGKMLVVNNKFCYYMAIDFDLWGSGKR